MSSEQPLLQHMPLELPSQKRTLIRRLTLPVLFSVGIHGVLIAGLLYASSSDQSLPQREDAPMQAMMISLSPAAAPDAATPQPVAAAEPEPVVESTPEPPPPEPIPIPEPVITPAPEPLPVAKPKPKPVKKEVTKPVQKKETRAPPQERLQESATDTATTAVSTAVDQAAVSQAPATQQAQQGPRALSRAVPGYPDRAHALGVEGKVRVQFDVESNGRVSNIRILSAEPPNMFEREIRQAMRKWRYESRAAQDLQMTIVFRLQGGAQLE